MELALPSTSTAVAATLSVPDSDHSTSGGIKDLKLTVGPVRRNLFGPVDHHQLQQDFQRLLCMSVEVANKRWNFDFQSDRPEQGATIMEWEELRFQDVPAFYRSCVVRRVAGMKAPRRMSMSSSSGQSSSSSSGSGDELPEETSRGRYLLKQPAKRRQASITDFYKVKRRRLLHYKGPSRQ